MGTVATGTTTAKTGKGAAGKRGVCAEQMGVTGEACQCVLFKGRFCQLEETT